MHLRELLEQLPEELESGSIVCRTADGDSYSFWWGHSENVLGDMTRMIFDINMEVNSIIEDEEF